MIHLLHLSVIGMFIVGSSVSISAAPGRERIHHIREVQDLRTGKSDAGFDNQTSAIAEAIAAGDEGLAYHVFLAASRMLDNEAYTSVLTTALTKFPERALKTFEYMPMDERKMILEALSNIDPEGFDSPAEAKRFNALIKDLSAKNAKIEEKIRLTDGRPAYIDDPDGYTNLRLEPSTKAPIIDEIKSGEEFLVTAESGDWCTVNSPRGDIGYLHKSRVHYKFKEK